MDKVLSPKYECKFCHKQFARESTFINHSCKLLKRDLDLKTPEGLSAWNYYYLWMTIQKRTVKIEHFINSNYYTTFTKFTKFEKKMKLPLPNQFIRFMVKKSLPPTMWERDDVYMLYIEYLDSSIRPMELVKLSISTLLKISDAYEIDICDIFNHIQPNELLNLIRLRKVSPYLLLASNKFRSYLTNMTTEQQSIINDLISPSIWADKISNNKPLMNDIKLLIKEMEL